jgi:uncharacterized BrkB/YihY/UPF0761 family membrane protein
MKNIIPFAYGLVTGAFIFGWTTFMIMDNINKNQTKQITNEQHHRENRQPVWQNDETLVYRTIHF